MTLVIIRLQLIFLVFGILNLFGFSFQWNPSTDAATSTTLVTAQAGLIEAQWLTTQSQIIPNGQLWEDLKRAGLSGGIRWTLTYLTRSNERCEGPSLPIIVDPSELNGAIYYWSTTDAGIMRLAVGDQSPEPFLTQATASQIFCPACHALSRDGRRIAFTKTSFPPFGDLGVSNTDSPSNLLFMPDGIEGYFPSFSPDPDILVAGSSGQVVIRNSNTGELLETLPLPPNTKGGIPDWSWQSDRIVGVIGPEGIANLIPNEGINLGSIYEWTKTGSRWNEPQLVGEPPSEGTNCDRPAYSPNDQWIAYNVEGENPNMRDEMSSNWNVDLWIFNTETNTPLRLDRANKGEALGNSWPKWSPYSGFGRLWLAFSSLRNYGNQVVNNQNGSAVPQIWITSIDPNAPPGQDPSSPAFWMPHQNPQSGNHIPYWSVYEKR